MNYKRIVLLVVVAGVAILLTAAIILPEGLAFLGFKNYQEKTAVSEGTTSPVAVVEAFYGWYLNYIGNPATGEFHNPLVEGAYRSSGYLSQGFIREIDELLSNGIQADPILMAQDIPQDFTVEPGAEYGTVLVHLRFGEDSIRSLLVSLIKGKDSWQITSISLAN